MRGSTLSMLPIVQTSYQNDPSTLLAQELMRAGGGGNINNIGEGIRSAVDSLAGAYLGKTAKENYQKQSASVGDELARISKDPANSTPDALLTAMANSPNQFVKDMSATGYGQLMSNMLTPQSPISVAPGTTLYDPRTKQPIFSAAPKPEAVPEGGTLVNPNTGQTIFSAPLKPMSVAPGDTLYDPRTHTPINVPTSPDALKAISDIAAAKKGGETVGETSGQADKTYTVMTSNLPIALQRFKEMREAANSASYGFGTNEEGTGLAQQFAKSSIGNDTTSKANALLQQRAAQGILPEIGPQLAQAGVRGNKFLETIANSASGLDLAAKPQDKVSLINGLENTYINNLKSTAAQLREKGKPAPSDAEINAMVATIRKGGIPAGMPNPIQNSDENIPTGGSILPANPSGSEKAVNLLNQIMLQHAKDAIAQGAPKAKVIERLRTQGIPTEGL